MSNEEINVAGHDQMTRRGLLRNGGTGAAVLLGGGALAALTNTGAPRAAGVKTAAAGIDVRRRLIASDGHMLLPGRTKPLLIFGFAEVGNSTRIRTLVRNYKGRAQTPGPILGIERDKGLALTLTNVGFLSRPDLPDSHTIHWHGFRNVIALFDGTPEMSISVPPGRDFPYFYKPRDAGTYMYHCHFEDVEHVQMGMVGIVYVTPAQNAGTGSLPAGRYAYDDGDGSTAYDREFTMLLGEIDTRPHDGLEAVQEFQWVDYDPTYFTINGRAYPDTIKPTADASVPSQPISSLVQANAGDRVLLRMASLGYRQHAMALTGIAMNVIAEDATLLRGRGGADLSHNTNTVYIGPGESRDVLFSAPAFDPGAVAGASAARGPWNTYLLKNRSLRAQTNAGGSSLGGMVTEVRIYRDPLPAQPAANQTL